MTDATEDDEFTSETPITTAAPAETEPTTGPGVAPLEADEHAWRSTFVVWAALAAFVMLWVLLLGTQFIALIRGGQSDPRVWYFTADSAPPLFAAKIVVYGGFLTPYTLNTAFVAMPLYAFVMVPVAALGELLNIPRPIISAALLDETVRATLTGADGQSLPATASLSQARTLFAPIVAIYGLLWLIPFLKAVRSLAWTLGARSRLWAVQLTAFAIGWFPAAIVFGHLEDGILMILVFYAVVFAARRQWTQVAIMLALAMGLKQTAVLVVPLFFFFVPKGERLRFTLIAASIPALLLVGVLLSDFASATRGLFNPPTFPGLGGGRTALFVTSDARVLEAGPARYGAFVCAALVALWLRRNQSVPVLLAGIAVTFAARLPFETVLHMYYSAPFLVGALVYRKCRDDRIWPTVTFGFAAMALFWVPAASVPAWAFWPLEVVFLGVATAPVWVDVVRRRFSGPSENDLVIPEAGLGAPTDDDATGTPTDWSGPGTGDSAAPGDVRTTTPADGVIL